MADESTTPHNEPSETALLPGPPSSSVLSVTRWKGPARFEIIGSLGHGGMGVVYEAFDRQRHERVALKTLLNFDAASLYRFKQEFRTLADVLHPNLVHLHELVAGERDDVFFTMELVEGADFLDHVHDVGGASNDRAMVPRQGDETEVVPVDLAARQARSADASVVAGAIAPGDNAPARRRHSPARYDKLRPAFRQLVDGVRALHGAGKLHRDLKPSNVRVTPEGRVVILDFGVATELRGRSRGDGGEDEVVGTIAYIAPEQASGEAPVTASDWYSVGAMLYEAMVGEPPFRGSPLEVLTLKYTVQPPAPSSRVEGVPEDLERLCMALLAPDPELRPGASEILRSLGATPSDRAPAPRTANSPSEVSLVGREVHLRALHGAFVATREGRAMAVRVAGLSGLGKSALVHHFLDELERRGDVLVLRGRAYERESVPYKAVDSVIDAITRHLVDQQVRGESIPLPEEIAALAHVFPVLRRVPSIDEVPQAPAGDLQVVRQRAFGALRELLGSLTERQPVVVFIDDVQWGDTDSVALLVELMRPPAAPPVLLLTTHRAEETDTSPFLVDLRARWPEDAEVRDLVVAPLAFDDARRLALALLGSDEVDAQGAAEAIAQESAGSPFLLEELAREGLATQASRTLEQMLGERAARLPVDARRVLETVAIGGRPLPVTTVGTASGTDEGATQLIALLQARRLVRVGLRGGLEVVEASHDRIRETIAAQLPEDVVREIHARLARVLEATPESDPEAIAAHLVGAGDRVRAAHYAERAAEQAIAKLAFAQGARLFQLTVDMIGTSSPGEMLRLLRRAAEASEWAGHGERAARAYLAAAELAPAFERLDLERAAATQLIAAGLVDEAAAVFRRVLAAIGRRVPHSRLGLILGIVLWRVVSVFMLRGKLRAPRSLSHEENLRLEVLHAVARGLAVVEPLHSNYVKSRFLVDALRSGVRRHLVRAAAGEASTIAGFGGQESKRERLLFEMARSLAEETGDLEGQGIYQSAFGISEYLRGRWRSSIEVLNVACRRLAAARRWQANPNVFGVYALTYLGELRQVKTRTARLIADADQRGDLYTVVNLRASHPTAAWLAADDVEGARRHLGESMAKWSRTRFQVQHWQAMLWGAETDLYAGEGARAWERIGRDARAIRRSQMLKVQLIRVLTAFVRGRSALASLATLNGAARQARLAEARRAALALEKEAMPWTAPLAAMVAAGAARAAGDDGAAADALRKAITAAETVEMTVHAAAGRHQLGTLLGGEQGGAMVREAEEAMVTRGIRVPHRYAQALVPGVWKKA